MKHSLRNARTFVWKRKAALPLLLSIVLTFVIVASVSAAVAITATKTYTFIGGDGDGKADPGETIEYTVAVKNNGVVPGADDATGVNFSDTIDANTTLAGTVAASPVGVNDLLPVTVTGNVAINTALMASPFSVITNDFPGQNMSPGLTISAFDTLSAQGGNVTMVTSGAGIGTFTYDPPAGYEGADSFTYTLSDNTNATSAATNRKATVTINVSGMIWFVNNNAALSCATDGCGRLSNPYSTLAAFNAANNGTDILFTHHPAANDNIFIYESASAYTGGITLLSGQKLIGQDSTQTLSAITGLSPVQGSLTLPAMNVGAPATVIQNAGGNGVTLNTGNTLNGFTAGNSSSSAISGSGFGTLTVADVIVNTTGQALSLTNGTLSATFPSVTSSGGTNNIALAKGAGTLTGALTINAGALSGATGNAFDLNGGTATITYVGSIASGSARSVNVTGLTGGTVTFSGAITDTDTGISLTTNTGATITFSGGLNLSTGANPAFNATGGGTINATQNNTSIVNTLTTTIGTALNIANTTIGASNVTFRSISANGSVNGIVLNTTGASGGLVVTGDAGSSNNSSGGTLQNISSSAIQLTSTQNVSLDQMNIQTTTRSGINGTGVTNFAFTNGTINNTGSQNSDANIAFNTTNFSGAQTQAGNNINGALTVTGSTLTNGYAAGLDVQSDAGTVTNANISNNTLTVPTATRGAISLVGTGNASTSFSLNNATINQNNITNTGASGIQVSISNANAAGPGATEGIPNDPSNIIAITNNSILPASSGTNAIIVANSGANAASRTRTNFLIQCNGKNTGGCTSPTGAALGSSSIGTVILIGNNGYATMTGTVNNNAILATHTPNLGGGNGIAGGNGVAGAGTAWTPNLTLLVTNNTISGTDGNGILLVDRATNGTDAIKIANNAVGTPVNAGGSARQGIRVDAGNGSAGEVVNLCLNITGNTSSGSNGAGSFGIRKEALSTFGIVGLSPSPATGAQATSFVTANNNPPAGQTTDNISTAGGDGVNYTVCSIPAIAFAPTSSSQALAQYAPEDNRMAASFAPSTDTNATTAFAPVYDLGSMYQPAALVTPNVQSVSPAAAPVASDAADRKAGLFAPPTAPALSGETVNVTIGTLPATKSVTIKFRVMVNDPLPAGTTRILNQSTISGSNFSNVTTTDPAPSADAACTAAPAIGTATCTPVDLPDTTVVSLTRQSANPSRNAAVTWQIVFANPIDGLTPSNFTLVPGGAVTGASISSVTEVSAVPATTWNITANTGTGDGSLGLNLTNGTGLTHDVINAPFTGEVYTIDKTAPTVTSIKRQSPATSPTNADVLVFRVTFNEAVTGVGANSFVDTGTTTPLSSSVTAVTPNLVFDFTVDGIADGGDLANLNGTVGLNVGAAPTITDLAGNPLQVVEPTPASNDETYTLDNIIPTVTINQAVGQADPTNAGPINLTVVFSEPVTGFATGDVTLSGTAGATTGTVTEIAPNNGTTYTVAVSGMTSNGTVIASIAAGAAQDAAGNNNAASTSTDNIVTYDTAAPTVTINQAAGQADPANASPLNFTVVFNEPVTGFATGDVTLAGTAGATTATVSEIAPNNGTTYTVAVSGMTSNGTVIASIAAGTAQDAAGNNNTASTSTDNTITYDATAPTVTINLAAGQTDPTSSGPINFTVVFNEPVTGFTTGDVTLAGTAGATTATVTQIAPNDGTTYTVAVSGMTVDGTVIATITGGVAQDAATNPNVTSTSTDNSVLYDTTPPDVMINQAVGQADPTNASTINFTVIFSEQVTGFATGDVTLAGTAGATTATVTGGPTIYNVAVTGMTSDGTVIASIAASVATDLASKPNNASTSTDNTVTYDATAPTVTINQAVGQVDPANTSPLNFHVVFSEPVTGFATGDVTLSGTAGATTGTVTEIAPNDGTTYTVAVSGMATDGTVIASISVGAAQDPAGNGNAASTSTDNTITYDATAPTVTINQAAGQADPTNTGPINFVVTFNEPVTGFISADVTLAGTAGATTATVTEIAPNDGTTYSVAVSGMTSDGTVIATIAAGVATDAAGNGNAASSSTDNTVTFDATMPTVTLSSAAPEPTNTAPIPVTVQFSKPVSGFDIGDITTGNGTVGNFVAVDGDTYTFDLTPIGQGLVTADIAAAVATDAAGNNNTAATQFSRTFDTVAPTVVISSVAPEPTNTSPIPVTVQFSEPVSGFDIGDITAGNGTVGNFVAVDGDTYTFDLTPIGQGPVTADIAAAVATDAAGNNTTIATQFSRTFDTVAPTVTIEQAAGQADPTNISPVNFVAVFSEPVTGFAGPDVSLSGTANATTASVTEIAPNDGTTYAVAVGGMTSSGTVIASIPAGAAQDAAANGNSISASTDNMVTFDPVFPVATGIVRADPSPTNAASVRFTVTFAKSVTGVDATDFTFTTSGVTGATITSVTGGGTTWTVTVNTGTGDGTLRLDLVDDDTIVDVAANQLGGKGLGNGNFTSGEVYTIDRTGPSVAAVVRANASPTNATTVGFTITFTEIITGVGTGDFSLATTGVSGATITSVTGSGTTWTATVNTGSGDGTIGLNLVDDDTIVDLVGNALGGVGTGNGNFTGEVYAIDKTAPQAGNLVATNIIAGSTLAQTFTVVFSDNLAINIASLDGNDIRVIGPSGFNQPATLVSVTPASNGSPRTATYQISAPGGAWDNADNGSYTVALQANQVSDTAGNTAAVGALGTFNVDVKATRFTVLLPMIMYSAAQAPDLVISSVTLTPSKTSFTASEPVQISVVIKNQGTAPTTPFWVDLYLNPSSTPALNLIWNKLCSLQPCYGIAWQITQPLAPGAEITLTSTVDSFATGYTNWHDRLAAGTTDLYVQADSWNPDKTVGASGDTNTANNLFHISGLHVTGQNVAGEGADVAIPERPTAR